MRHLQSGMLSQQPILSDSRVFSGDNPMTQPFCVQGGARALLQNVILFVLGILEIYNISCDICLDVIWTSWNTTLWHYSTHNLVFDY